MRKFYRSLFAAGPLLRFCQPTAHSTSAGWRMLCWVFVLLLLGAAHPAAATDIDIVKERVRADLLTSTSATDTDAATWLNLMNAQGQFSDINYADRDRNTWQPIVHLRRLHRMALLYYQPSSSYYQSADVLTKFQHGITYYMGLFDAGNISSDNWYFNRIGQQLEMGQLLIIMQPAAPASVTLGSRLLQGTINTTTADKCGENACTAQNMTWVSTVVIYKGCLTNNASQVALGFSNIQSTLSLRNDDGIQYDFSFHQHDVQLYSGGYGINFAQDISYWMTVVKSTAYAFSAASVDSFSQFLLNGDAWMVRGAVFDYSTRGREITRKQPAILPTSSALSLASDRMATLGTAQQANLTALANAVRAGSTTATGNRHFWRSDYTTHQRPGYFTSLRMFSTRLVGSENVNGENALGYYLAHGATFIYRQGNEYNNIFPTWDWAHIPGVTSQHVTPKPLKDMYIYTGNYPRGSTSFVGGVSDGTNGLSYLTYSENGVKARKAWFFFDEGFFAFGAGITSTSGTPIHTTLNQCLLNGPVTVGEGTSSTIMDRGQFAYASGSRWVNHNEVGYVFPASTNVGLKIGSQSGRWSAINGSYKPTTTGDSTTLDVFNLWVYHGTNPSGATYQYIVLPNKTAAQTSDFANSGRIQTLSNTTSRQAVYCKTQKLAGLVFSVAGTQTLPAGYSITVDQPCLMLVQEQAGQLAISVSNPLNAALDVNVDVTSPANVVTRTLFSLPGGNDGGKTLTKVVVGSFFPNLALNKPVSVSSSSSSAPSKQAAVDGNAATRWSSNYTDKEWLYVDLGASYDVNEVKITWQAAYGKDFDVEISTDASTWTPLQSVIGNTKLVNDLTGFSGTGRYVRLNGKARGTKWGYSIFELEVYGAPTEAQRVGTTPTTQSAVAEAGALTVFPNPTTATPTVTLNGVAAFPATAEIYDPQGTRLQSTQLKQANDVLDVSKLVKGLYTIRVSSPQTVQTVRLQKD